MRRRHYYGKMKKRYGRPRKFRRKRRIRSYGVSRGGIRL